MAIERIMTAMLRHMAMTDTLTRAFAPDFLPGRLRMIFLTMKSSKFTGKT
jgi:hypothetical protein